MIHIVDILNYTNQSSNLYLIILKKVIFSMC